MDEKIMWDVADRAIELAYPNSDCRSEKGWWGCQRIPNFGILRGAIVKEIFTLLSEKEKEIKELKEARHGDAGVVSLYKEEKHDACQRVIELEEALTRAICLIELVDPNNKLLDELTKKCRINSGIGVGNPSHWPRPAG